ncbi:unnamed protein product [Closterium sp. NIES-54]
MRLVVLPKAEADALDELIDEALDAADPEGESERAWQRYQEDLASELSAMAKSSDHLWHFLDGLGRRLLEKKQAQAEGQHRPLKRSPGSISRESDICSMLLSTSTRKDRPSLDLPRLARRLHYTLPSPSTPSSSASSTAATSASAGDVSDDAALARFAHAYCVYLQERLRCVDSIGLQVFRTGAESATGAAKNGEKVSENDELRNSESDSERGLGEAYWVQLQSDAVLQQVASLQQLQQRLVDCAAAAPSGLGTSFAAGKTAGSAPAGTAGGAAAGAGRGADGRGGEGERERRRRVVRYVLEVALDESFRVYGWVNYGLIELMERLSRFPKEQVGHKKASWVLVLADVSTLLTCPPCCPFSSPPPLPPFVFPVSSFHPSPSHALSSTPIQAMRALQVCQFSVQQGKALSDMYTRLGEAGVGAGVAFPSVAVLGDGVIGNLSASVAAGLDAGMSVPPSPMHSAAGSGGEFSSRAGSFADGSAAGGASFRGMGLPPPPQQQQQAQQQQQQAQQQQQQQQPNLDRSDSHRSLPNAMVLFTPVPGQQHGHPQFQQQQQQQQHQYQHQHQHQQQQQQQMGYQHQNPQGPSPYYSYSASQPPPPQPSSPALSPAAQQQQFDDTAQALFGSYSSQPSPAATSNAATSNAATQMKYLTNGAQVWERALDATAGAAGGASVGASGGVAGSYMPPSQQGQGGQQAPHLYHQHQQQQQQWALAAPRLNGGSGTAGSSPLDQPPMTAFSGGWDQLLLDSLYEAAQAQKHASDATAARLGGAGGSGVGASAAGAGGSGGANGDPFAASAAVPPPPYVQMALRAQQQLAMELQRRMLSQHARFFAAARSAGGADAMFAASWMVQQKQMQVYQQQQYQARPGGVVVGPSGPYNWNGVGVQYGNVLIPF